ncbi:MAG TPA: c-type cytochrome biogenesis protein CcmI [Gallionellaceae bacterium]
MIQFWIFSALLMGLAALFIVLPLWRSNLKDHSVQRNAANLEIFRDQIAEMDADLRNGLLTPELYEQGKRELQARVLDEAGEAQAAAHGQPRNRLRLLALALIVVLPLLAVGLYWQLGNRQALLPQMSQTNQATFSLLRSETALKQLEQKLAEQPDSPEGWLLLARSYSELDRFAESARAYDKLTQLVPNDAQLWADYADVVAMLHDQSLQGLPTRLLNKALDLDPNNGKALALSGSAAMERGDYAAAVRYWENLLKLIPPGTEGADMVESGVKQARAFMAIKGEARPMLTQPQAGEKQTAAAGAERISGVVTLSEKLKAKASPEDTVFVLARAAQGPKMPLAIIRKQVKDLPLKFSLDDSMAMSPQMKLSSFDQLVVVARISKSGNAMPQAGDMQGISGTLKPGSQGIKLSIDTLVQ